MKGMTANSKQTRAFYKVEKIKIVFKQPSLIVFAHLGITLTKKTRVAPESQHILNEP